MGGVSSWGHTCLSWRASVLFGASAIAARSSNRADLERFREVTLYRCNTKPPSFRDRRFRKICGASRHGAAHIAIARSRPTSNGLQIPISHRSKRLVLVSPPDDRTGSRGPAYPVSITRCRSAIQSVATGEMGGFAAIGWLGAYPHYITPSTSEGSQTFTNLYKRFVNSL